MAEMREFLTGATRNLDKDKLDYEGFFSPLVLQRRALYMHKNRLQADGKLRDSDNWQKGIPFTAYMKSAFRHFMDFWQCHRMHMPAVDMDTTEEAICALMFNCEGYLHELLKIRHEDVLDFAKQEIQPAIDIAAECRRIDSIAEKRVSELKLEAAYTAGLQVRPYDI